MAEVQTSKDAPTSTVDLEDGDDTIPVTRETSRGGREPPQEVNDRPDQNVAYDEVVKGAPLTAEEKARALALTSYDAAG